MKLEPRIALLDEILEPWAAQLGADRVPYTNHVYRVLHFCFALRPPTDEERRKLVIAGAFHDLGIWSDGTLDYLPPSVALARRYLDERRLGAWSDEVALVIDLHHRLRAFRDERWPLVEPFRRADLVDVSMGRLAAGLPASYVREVQGAFPNAGFHRRLVQLGARWIPRHPLRPAPFVRW